MIETSVDNGTGTIFRIQSWPVIVGLNFGNPAIVRLWDRQEGGYRAWYKWVVSKEP